MKSYRLSRLKFLHPQKLRCTYEISTFLRDSQKPKPILVTCPSLPSLMEWVGPSDSRWQQWPQWPQWPFEFGYPPVIKHGNGKSHINVRVFIGKSPINVVLPCLITGGYLIFGFIPGIFVKSADALAQLKVVKQMRAVWILILDRWVW